LIAWSRARGAAAEWWRGLSARQRGFTINILIGIALSLVLNPIENNTAISKVRDALLTWQTAQFGDTDLGKELVWIDIDDSTYAAWGSPYVSPRDKICRLIDFAVRGGARVVVVDFDLSSRAVTDRRAVACDSRTAANAPAANDADSSLRDYLRGHTGSVPVILTRILRSSATLLYANGEPAREVRPSFVDPLPARANVVWSAPFFDLDDDYMVRRWRLWEPVCGAKARALPSTELLAVAAYNGKNLAALQNELDGALAPICLARAAGQPAANLAPVVEHDVDIGFPLTLGESSLDRRFFFRFGWTRHPSGEYGTSLAAFIPARLITETDVAHRFSSDIVRGRIAVIGGSFADNPDFLRTPLGTMPGTLVLANAINALANNDHIREVPWFLRVLVEGSLVVLLSALFLYFSPRAAMLLSSLIVVVTAFSVGYIFLNNGYWIDPVLPLLGIQAHELIAGLEHRFQRKRNSP
jgi:CHASE2 domain-containing sensor protein